MNFTEEDIKTITTELSYHRGIEYYHEGLVEIKKLTNDFVRAEVEGSDTYIVKVNLNDLEDYDCSCPYDRGGACKHVAAVLLEVLDRQKVGKIAPVSKKPVTAGETPDDILKKASPGRLREFLKKEMDDNPELKERFLILFEKDPAKENSLTVEYYRKKMIKSMEECDRYHSFIFYTAPDFDRFYKVADIWLSKDMPLEAMKIYRAASESIAEVSGGVDDSDGYFSGEFELAVEEFTDIAAGLDLPKKRARLSIYLTNIYGMTLIIIGNIMKMR